jgi:hypothetical protein
LTVNILNSGANVANFKLTVLSPGLARKPSVVVPGAQWTQLDSQRWALVFSDLKSGQQSFTIQFN